MTSDEEIGCGCGCLLWLFLAFVFVVLCTAILVAIGWFFDAWDSLTVGVILG